MTFMLTAVTFCWFMNLKLGHVSIFFLLYWGTSRRHYCNMPMTCTQIAAPFVVELFEKLWLEITFVFGSANTINDRKLSMTSTAAVFGRGWIEKMLHSLWSEREIKGNSRSCVYETLWCFISHQEIQQYEAWWKTFANWARWN